VAATKEEEEEEEEEAVHLPEGEVAEHFRAAEEEAYQSWVLPR
jgi:hypothetical protein